MSVAAIRRMLSAGLTIDQALTALEALEAEDAAKADAAAEKRRAQGAARQRAYIARKKQNDAADGNDGDDAADALYSSPNSSPYIARADAPGCSNDFSNEKSILDNPDLKVGPLTPKEPARSARLILFDRFYAAYPKHTNRKAAEAKFLAAVRNGVDAERIISGAAMFAEATRRARTEKHFIPAPDVWLNRGKWDDEDLPEAVTPQARAGPNSRGGFATLLAESLADGHVERTEKKRTSETVQLLPIGEYDRSGTGGDHDGGVSRNPVELLVGNSFRRM